MRTILLVLALCEPASAERFIREATPATNNSIFVSSLTARVGISTNNPQYPLDVHGDVNSDGYYRGNGSLLTGISVNSEISTNTITGVLPVAKGGTASNSLATVEVGTGTAARNYLTGGTIESALAGKQASFVGISSGCAAGQFLSTGTWVNGVTTGGGCVAVASLVGGINGSGTAGRVPYLSAATTLADSPIIRDNATSVTHASSSMTIQGSLLVAPVSCDGTGGTITHSGGYTYHAFTANDTFAYSGACGSQNVEVLVVAGGGGAGKDVSAGTSAGGGGAGGLCYNASYSIGTSTSISVVVGPGGVADTTNRSVGNKGSASIFGGIVAVGGGPGEGYVLGANTALNGGSGGGGAGEANNVYGVSSQTTPSGGATCYGNSGGYQNAGYEGAGGGGGAGAAGGANGSNGGQNGGAGLQYTQFASWGSPAGWFAGGGGGSGSLSYGNGGNGGGATANSGSSGVANTGGGGAAGAYQSDNGTAGGSGIVLLRYLTYQQAGATINGNIVAPAYPTTGAVVCWGATGLGHCTAISGATCTTCVVP